MEHYQTSMNNNSFEDEDMKLKEMKKNLNKLEPL